MATESTQRHPKRLGFRVQHPRQHPRRSASLGNNQTFFSAKLAIPAFPELASQRRFLCTQLLPFRAYTVPIAIELDFRKVYLAVISVLVHGLQKMQTFP